MGAASSVAASADKLIPSALPQESLEIQTSTAVTVDGEFEEGSEKMALTSNESYKFNAFLMACKSDEMSVDCCEEYLASEPNAVFASDHNGDTAIHFAANNRNLELLRTLVTFKVNYVKKPPFNRRSTSGITSMSLSYSHSESVDNGIDNQHVISVC